MATAPHRLQDAPPDVTVGLLDLGDPKSSKQFIRCRGSQQPAKSTSTRAREQASLLSRSRDTRAWGELSRRRPCRLQKIRA
ncbi:hypothetical protein CRUP_016202 [Coryphaenoides rupestris]|nr:hypothetical protein CRUP_016202 [Coryphaenoides rupestris]